jgi:hypothetical protein
MKKLTLMIALGFLTDVAVSQTTIDSSANALIGAALADLEPDKQLTDSIVNDLLKLRIITDQTNVTFYLNPEMFEVDHKKQPAGTLDVFKKKYHIVKGYSIFYAKTKGSTATSITKKD